MSQTMTWEPGRYLTFGAERQQPALDLMAAIPERPLTSIVDLGCGAGGNAEVLRDRFPRSRITGVDSSPEMLAEACKREGIHWVRADIADWRPDHPPSLIFSNAALHWLGDHATLFPRLLSVLEPDGVLAVQMPNNFAAPTHTAIAETALSGSWRAKLEPMIKETPVAPPGFYYGLLAPLCKSVRLWQTEYIHVLSGKNPVADWTRGTALKPFLDALEGKEREDFFEAYAKRIAEAYPPEPDGRTLMPFRRFFLVAETV